MLQRDCFDLPRSRMPCTITSCCIVFYISFISLTNLGYRVTVIDVCTGRLSFSCKLGGDYILLIWAHWMLMVRDNHALNFREWTWRWYSVSVAWVKLEIRFHSTSCFLFFFLVQVHSIEAPFGLQGYPRILPFNSVSQRINAIQVQMTNFKMKFKGRLGGSVV